MDETPLGEDDLHEILTYLKDVQAQCYNIGTALHLKQDTLETIKQKSADHAEALTKIVNEWLRRNYNFERFGEPTWKALSEAVGDPIGGANTALALKIKESHQENSSGTFKRKRSSSLSSPTHHFTSSSGHFRGSKSVRTHNSSSSSSSKGLGNGSITMPALRNPSTSSSSSRGLYGAEVSKDHPNGHRGVSTSEGNEADTPMESTCVIEVEKQGAIEDVFENEERPKPQIDEVLFAIRDVSDWRSLGKHLGIESSKLDEIGRYPIEEQKSKMVVAWFECDEDCTWEKLEETLKKPSLSEVRVAERVRRTSLMLDKSLLKSPLKDSIETTLSPTSTRGDDLVPFTESNVLDAITKISNYHDLGLILEIPPHKLSEIEQHPVQDRRQLFVSALFRCAPEQSCNWKKVNGAINQVSMSEWAAKKSGSMTKSSSYESQLSSISSAAADESSKLQKKMTTLNTTKIKRAYSKLMRTIRKKLKSVDLDTNDFYELIVEIFEPEKISRLIPNATVAGDIDMTFEILTKAHCWGFGDVSKLKSIVEEFIEEDDGIQKMITDYKDNLTGYNATTKIIEQIQSLEISEGSDDEEECKTKVDTSKYDHKFRKSLRAKLYKSESGTGRLDEKSLEYVGIFWKEICEEFVISLDGVLEQIVKGCIEITWHIPSPSAQQILAQIHGSVQFFQRKFVSNIILEDVIIYSESFGVATEKTLSEVKLLLAVQDESLSRTLTLLPSPGNINMEMAKNDMTLLMIAARDGNSDIVSALLEHGADVDKQDVDGWTATHYAVHYERVDTVSRLLERDGDLTLTTKSGSTILNEARNPEIINMLKSKLGHQLVKSARDGNLSLVESILKMGVDVDFLDPENEMWTPLMWASKHGHLDVVQHLLLYSPNVNAAASEKEKGWTPLTLASAGGHCDIIRTLLDHGADVNKKTARQWSSLMMTANVGHVEAGKLLLERGAQIDSRDVKTYTPLAQACQNGHHKFVQMLIDHDPHLDLNIQEIPGLWTPLMLACKNGRTEAANVLLKHGADIEQKKRDGINALHIAAFAGHNNTVDTLIRNNANLNAADHAGITALMYATRNNQPTVANTLLNAGANLNFQEKEGKLSAAFIAVQGKHNDMLELFMRNETLDWSLKDKKGHTLLDLAEMQNEDALRLMNEGYKDKMDIMRASRASGSDPSKQPARKVDSKRLTGYASDVLRGMDIRMTGRSGIAASAA